MDWLTFFARLIEAAAWPSATTVLAFLFRQEIKKKIGDLSDAKGLGFDWSFQNDLISAERTLEESYSEEEKIGSPRELVLKAYEKAETAMKAGTIQEYRIAPRKIQQSLVSETEAEDRLIEPLKTAFNQLRQLKERVEHEPETRISKETAQKFAATAKEIQYRIQELSEREKQIWKLIAQGLSNRDIADKLGISERTVQVHRAHIMEKTGTNSTAELLEIYKAHYLE